MLPTNAIRIHRAHRILKKQHRIIAKAVLDSPVEPIFELLHKQERYIDLSKRHYFLAWLANQQHVWRRRGASAKQQSLFAVLEYSGRAVAELALPRVKKVTPTILTELETLLQPGDIFITRHNRALTNLFLPGFWPHAALYVGSEAEREALGVQADPAHLKHWHNKNRTFEALKDGVHFRPLEETLSVDAFVLLRPNFSRSEVAQALSRVVVHAGKGYNFDFDFFRSDQLVCTEVIYRAFDGINGKPIPLQERMGRKTLSAEDILDLNLNSNWGSVIAVFGIGESKHTLVTGRNIHPILEKSYSSS